ncbi:MAG: hypothetical protein J7L99_02560 [Planctomycetes bacterium]|nr:hypothetical protein [Planctomycetota bacterium]
MSADYTAAESQQYLDALKTIRAAKNWFWWLVFLAVVIQLGSFAVVRFAGVIDKAAMVQRLQSEKADKPANQSEKGKDESLNNTSAEVWYETLAWVLPTGKFVAMVSGLLLILTMLLAVEVSLVGKTGGAGKFTSAFFWSLLLWAMLIPWQQVGTFRSTFACGALCNLQDLIENTAKVAWGAKNVPILTQIFYYARFVAYPTLVILVSAVVQLRFARGRSQALAGLSPVGSGSNEVKI